MDRLSAIRSTPLLFSALLFAPLWCHGAILNVHPTVCNDTTGSPAYCTITAALAAANATDHEIHIAAGTYTELLDITKDVELLGVGADQTFLDGNNAFRPVTISGGAVVQLNSLTVQRGSAAWGGGIFVADVGDSLSIIACVLTNNLTTDSGGAIASWGTLSIEESRLTGNTASSGGGAIFVGNGATTVLNSVVDQNHAVNGGALFVSAGTAAVTNSTVSDNVASGGQGGALYKQGGSATFTNATVAGNASTTSNVGGIYSNTGIVTLQNTLVAGNTNIAGTQDCGEGGGASMASLGHNFIGTTVGCTVTPLPGAVGDILDQGLAAAGLDPLADNGGPTLTRALLTGSAAIDTGGDCLTEDQRGETRPTDGDDNGTAICDIGAFEAAGTNTDDDGDSGGGGGGGSTDLAWLALLTAGLGLRRRPARA